MKRVLLVGLLLCLGPIAHATVGNTGYIVSYTCTGTVGPFGFTFPVSDATAITVTMNGNLVNTANYTTVPINNNFTNGGKVTLNVSNVCQNGWPLIIERVTPITQTTKYYDGMPTPFGQFEKSLDKLTEIAQETWGETVKSLQIQNNGVNVDGAIQGVPGTMDFTGCSVTGTAATKFVINCAFNQAKINNIVFLDGFTNTTLHQAITSCGSDPCIIMVTSGTYFSDTTETIGFPLTISCSGTGASVIQTSSAINGSPFLTFTNASYGADTISGCLFDMTASPNSDATVWNGTQLSSITNTQFNYPTSGAGTGRAIVRTSGVEMHATDVDIFGAYNCVSINGDNGQEDHWTRVGCYSPGSYGFDLERTTSTDVGGQHLWDFKINNPANRPTSAGFKLFSSSGSHALNPFHAVGITADGMQGGAGLSVTNWQSVYVQGAGNWLTAVNDPGVSLKDVTLPIIIGNRIASGATSDVQWDGQITAARFTDNEFDGSGTYAFSTGGSWTGCSNSFFADNHNGHGSGFATDADNTKLLGCGRSTNASSTSGAVFDICSSATNCSLALVNPTTAAVNALKYITLDPTDGSMSLWNSTFSTRIFKWFENGDALTNGKVYVGGSTLAYLGFSAPTLTLAFGEASSAFNYSTSSHVGSFSANGTPIFSFGGGSSLFNVLTTLQLSSLTGVIQCLHTDTTGIVSGTGFDCGAGGLPDQTGQAGKFLHTNGTTADWNVPPGGGTVIGPVSSVTNNGASFADTSGQVLKDSGISLSVFNSANKLLQMTAAGKLPAVDGSLLTAVNASTINGGAVPLTATILGSNGSGQPVNNTSVVALPSGTLTSGACLIGNGTNSLKADTGCSTDGAGHLTIASLTGSGVTAGYFNLGYGADNGVPGSGYLGWEADTSGALYRGIFPNSVPVGTQFMSCTDLGGSKFRCGWSTAGAGNVSTTTANTYTGGTGILQDFSAVSIKAPTGINAAQNFFGGADIAVVHARGGVTTFASAANTDVSRGLQLSVVCGPGGAIVESDVIYLNNETFDLASSGSLYCDLTQGGTLSHVRMFMGGATIKRQFAGGNTNPAAVTVGLGAEVAGPGTIICNNASNGSTCETINNGNGSGDGYALLGTNIHGITINGQFDSMVFSLPASSTNTLYTSDIVATSFFDSFTAGPTGSNTSATLTWYMKNLQIFPTTESVNKDISCWKSSFSGSGNSAIYYLDGVQSCTMTDAIGGALVNGLLIGGNTTVYTSPSLTIDTSTVTTSGRKDINVSAATATLNLADGAQWNTAKFANSGTVNTTHNVFGLSTIPTSTNGVKTSSTGAVVSQVASDVVAEFSGTPTGSKFLRDDGTLAVPSVGSVGFDAITSGSNTTATMTVGTGATLGPTGSGTVTANAYSGTVPSANGGLGIDTSASTGVPVDTSGSWLVVAHLPTSKGGTNIDTSSSTGVCQVVSGTWSCASTALNNGITATTQSANDSSTKVATTAYVDTKATTPSTPWIGAAGADPICDTTNANGYTCTAVGTTKTYFANFVTIPTAATAGKIDGIHNGLSLYSQWNNGGGGISTYTMRLSACSAYSAQTCTGEVVLWTSSATQLTANATANCIIGVASTATTLSVGCSTSGSGFSPNTSSTISTSVPNSGSNWILIWSVQYGTGSMVVASSLNMMAAGFPY